MRLMKSAQDNLKDHLGRARTRGGTLTETGQNRQGNSRKAAPRGGWRRYRGLVYTVSAIALFAGVIAGTVAFDATGDAQTNDGVYASPTVAGASTAPAIVTPAIPATDAPVTDGPTSTIAVPTESPEPQPTITGTPAATGTTTVTPTVGEAASATPTLGEAWSATPTSSTPGPTAGLWPAAADLVDQIEAEWGIDVVTEGQNWGSTEAQQLKNLGALAGALEALPANAVAAATHNDHGTLAVLSNNAGRTLAGWQPYGSGAANFYATEDFGSDGRFETSQIVLQTGSSQMTIAHELLHAYQMRDVASGMYGEALLTDEMTSFMAATGWQPNVSAEVLATSVDGSWESIGALFDYSGPELVYESEIGEMVHAHTPNPVEAFAVVGALYYSAPEGTPVPGWADYWAWFDANLG